MPNRRTFGHFLAFSEDKLFWVKKEDMSSKRRTYGNQSWNEDRTYRDRDETLKLRDSRRDFISQKLENIKTIVIH